MRICPVWDRENTLRSRQKGGIEGFRVTVSYRQSNMPNQKANYMQKGKHQNTPFSWYNYKKDNNPETLWINPCKKFTNLKK